MFRMLCKKCGILEAIEKLAQIVRVHNTDNYVVLLKTMRTPGKKNLLSMQISHNFPRNLFR